MSENDFNSMFRKIMIGLVVTVISSMLISFGSMYKNNIVINQKVSETEKRIDKTEIKIEQKANKIYVDEKYKGAEMIGMEKEKRFNETIISVKNDVNDLKNEQKETRDLMLKYQSKTNELLWKINDKIKD